MFHKAFVDKFNSLLKLYKKIVTIEYMLYSISQQTW